MSDIKYFFKEIGGGDWWHCNKEFYEYASESPEFDTKKVEDNES